MRVRQWASNQQDFLRWLLDVPVLWRIAERIILKHIPHEADLHCLYCTATAKRLRFTHEVTMGYDRQLYCKKCGLPMRQWLNNRRCKGKVKKVGAEPVKVSPVKIMPINWD